MSAGNTCRAAAAVAIAGLTTVVTLHVLPGALALTCAVVLAVLVVHRLAPLRSRAAGRIPSA
ncbi:MAG: hypothetical protein ACR2K2_05340 [Mycobacteriales bacterium]